VLFRQAPSYPELIHNRQRQSAFLISGASKPYISVEKRDLAIITGATKDQIIMLVATIGNAYVIRAGAHDGGKMIPDGVGEGGFFSRLWSKIKFEL
jgi:hypothetical protein